MGEESRKSLEHLLQHYKIASVYNGYLDSKPENLKIILESVDSSKIGVDCSVAILAVMGRESSGKSFLTNLLIHCLRFGEEGGWMSDILKRSENGEPMTSGGFAWESVKHPNFLEPQLNAKSTSGVYLWPEPFLIKKSNGKEVAVWIMHVHSEHQEKLENIEQLERFLALSCSRIMEIQWKTDELRLLEQMHFLLSNDNQSHPATMEELCRSGVFVTRSGDKKTAKATYDKQAKKILVQSLENSGKEHLYEKLLNNFQHVNLIGLKDSSDALHDNNGILNAAAFKSISTMIRKIVDTMVDENEIQEKITGITGNNGLTLGNMLGFIINAAEKVSRRNIQDNSPMLKKEVEHESGGNQDNGLQSTFRGLERTKIQENQASLFESPKVHHQQVTNGERHIKLYSVDQYIQDKSYCNSDLQSSMDIRTSSTFSKHQTVTETKLEVTSTRVLVREFTSCNQSLIQKAEDYHSREIRQQTYPEDQIMKANDESWVVVEKEHSSFDQHQPTCSASAETLPLLETSIDDAMKEDNINLEHQLHQDLQKLQEKQRLETEKAAAEESERKRKIAKQKEERDKKLAKGKEEKEEKLRLEIEKARSSMDQTFHITVRQMQETFPIYIKGWIINDLNLKKIKEIESLYSRLLSEFTDQHQNAVHPKLWQEYIRRVDDHRKSECTIFLKNVSEKLLQIKNGIKKQFDFHGYFSPKKLESIANEEFTKATNNIGEGFLLEVIRHGWEKLLGIYRVQNQKIYNIEKGLHKEVVSELASVYRQQMKRYMKNAPFSPERLTRIHTTLGRKLKEACQKACSLGTIGGEEKTTEDVVALEKEMEQHFVSFKVKNYSELERLQKEIDKIIKNMKNEYNESIEEVLTKNPDGLDASTLSKYNENIKANVIKLLEMEVKQKIRKDEPIYNHKKVVQAHMDDYWLVVMETNKRHLQMKRERDEEESRERQAREKAQKQYQSRSETASQSRFDSTSAGESSSWRKSQDSTPSLPPLIFHLQSTGIVMATEIQGHTTVIRNQYGESQTPPVVSIRDNNFAFGTEAAMLMQEASSRNDGGFDWKLESFFLAIDFPWWPRITINNMGYTVSHELVLAYLLRNLKHAAELTMRGRFNTAVILIPFWLSSTQRIVIKSAAEIAGFSNIYLLNEASAAAYNIAVNNDSIKLERELLVISESMDRVDVFVYSYKAYGKELKMVGHSRIYDMDDEENSTGIMKTLKDKVATVASGVSSFFSSEDAVTDSEKEKAEKAIRHACKVSIERASKELRCYYNVQPDAWLFICEKYAKWGSIFENVILGFGGRAKNASTNDDVLEGAAVLSHRTDYIGLLIQDRLAYQVLRSANEGGKKVFPRNELLRMGKKPSNTTLPKGHTYTEIYQVVMRNKHSIGILAREKMSSCDNSLEAVLEITSEAIVTLDLVKEESFSAMYKKRMLPNQYQWTTEQNLPKDQVKNFAALLDIALPAPSLVDHALIQAKDELLQKCLDITTKISNGQFKIRSQLVKEKVLEQVEEAEQFAKHENSLIESVQKQLGILEKLYEKYDKK